MNCRGFTVLEGLIVVGIVGLLLAAGGPAIGEYVKNARLRTVAEQVRDGLNATRTEAIRRNTTVNFVPNATGWSVVVPASGQAQAVTVATRAPFAVETSVTATPSVSQIAYSGNGRLTTTGPFTVQVTQTGSTCAASGGSALCLNVVALRGGLIRVCDTSQPASKPEGC